LASAVPIGQQAEFQAEIASGAHILTEGFLLITVNVRRRR
jgi:hypothetical protein